MAALAAYPLLPASAQTLSTRSPFMPEGAAAAGVPTDNAPLELRGIVATKDGYLFGLFDPSKKQSTWARLNEPGANFVVRSHDVANETVNVEYQGRTLTLALKTAKVESMGVLPNPALANMPRPPNQPTAILNPSAADEARRLEGVAAEVRRRRMLRQAAAQQPGGPAVAPGPVAVPGQHQPGGVPQPK
ncbi:hypothetical protein DB347_04445 [Opitutaceae bacterium EW11]|nr:hypothetical protein DB347_04445 [Opitutaceae bacterium EW11]